MGKELTIYGKGNDERSAYAKTARVLKAVRQINHIGILIVVFGYIAMSLGLVGIFSIGDTLNDVFRIFGFEEGSLKPVFAVCITAAIIIGGLYYLQTLEEKKSYLLCPHCSTKISILKDWICGECNHIQENEGSGTVFRSLALRTHIRSIVNECSECNVTSPAFRCPHCSTTVITYPKDYKENSSVIARFDFDETPSNKGASDNNDLPPLERDLR